MDHGNSEEPHASARGSSGRTVRKRTRGPSSTQKSLSSTSTNSGLTKSLGGDPPPFSDWTSLARDPSGQSMYMYGGVRPNSQTSTSDFYRLDFETKSWTNLTNALLYIDGLPNPSKAKKKALPILDHPSCAFLTAHDRKFVTLFGGDKGGRAVSSLIIIDVEHYLWWEVDGAVTPRINAASVGIGNRLYIFGGHEVPLADTTFRSYSVVEYDANGDWTWVIQDRPYPASLPAIPGIGAAAVSLYGGKKILLTPGRITQKAPMHFSGYNMVLFHTQNETFHAITETVGNFPQNVRWYQLHVIGGSGPFPAQVGDKRKRNAESDQLAVLIVAWVPYGKDELIPEVWKYLPSPDETITCLGLRKQIWDMDQDLQSSACLGGRLLLMGQRGNSLVWDIYVDITDMINAN